MELVNVFDWMELPEELWETVSFRQNNPSYKRVDFDDGEWDEKGKPLDKLARVAQWAKDNSAFNTRSPQYALFFVEW